MVPPVVVPLGDQEDAPVPVLVDPVPGDHDEAPLPVEVVPGDHADAPVLVLPVPLGDHEDAPDPVLEPVVEPAGDQDEAPLPVVETPGDHADPPFLLPFLLLFLLPFLLLLGRPGLFGRLFEFGRLLENIPCQGFTGQDGSLDEDQCIKPTRGPVNILFNWDVVVR